MRDCFGCAAWARLLSIAGLLLAAGATAQDEPDDELVTMIAELVRDEDRDMRGLGLQQVREQVPGEAATRRFAALLPSLMAEGQAALLAALGDRGDATAHPAIVQMLVSGQPAVRAAALSALGSLGGAADVPLLAEKVVSGSPAERQAAAASLVRLRGEEAARAIVAVCQTAEPAVLAGLLHVLGRRNARETLPMVLAAARQADSVVQLAALDALRMLAEAKDAAELVGLVQNAPTETARRKAQLALLAACHRGREACAPAVIDGMNGADAAVKRALLPALARSGGPAALESLLACTIDGDPAVQDDAMRLLAVWDDPAVASRLLEIAGSSLNRRHQVLALRGLVRQADAREDRPADAAQLLQAMQLAQRPDEQRLVLGALSRAAEPEALAVALTLLDDPRVKDEAALAVLGIAQTLGKDSSGARQALDRVLEASQNSYVREWAQQVLE